MTVDAGAALVIAHHTHVAQGFEWIDGVAVVHCLGNFAFDQDRAETMQGLLAQVDMTGAEVGAVRAIPIYLEDYRPRLYGGGMASRFLRRIGEFSWGDDVVVAPHGQVGWVLPVADVDVQERMVEHDLEIGEQGWALVDLREVADADESLASVDGPSELAIRPGRDLLLFGDFEDEDADDDVFEATRWDLSGSSREVCLEGPYRGTSALCSYRQSSNSSDSVTAFRNRIRVWGDADNEPVKDLSLVAAVRGDNAGAVEVVVRYYASAGDGLFGEEAAIEHPGGSFGWTPYAVDLSMPPDDPAVEDPATNPRALRLFVRQAPPAEGDGLAVFDDFAVVSWEEEITLDEPVALATPHGRDFVRVEGPPGTYRVTLGLQRFVPIAVD